ncbi:hypothetical protein DPMN_006006 [Dreissena polymorpha]|uniref:Uncharacterized protein n=1 Tax=Dreissena polymorpha TaxID=45954 RepID=A0A9D4RX07_DREPO|nr:hypothetical protein DPMN_006006 [Dreissena polymorpha]
MNVEVLPINMETFLSTSGEELYKYTLNGKQVCSLYRSFEDTGKNHGESILITFVLCTGIFLAIVGKGVVKFCY